MRFSKRDSFFKAKQIYFVLRVLFFILGYVFITKMGFITTVTGTDGIGAHYIFPNGNTSGA